MDREHIKSQLPKITEKQLDILEFWAVRGWDGISRNKVFDGRYWELISSTKIDMLTFIKPITEEANNGTHNKKRLR